MIVLHKFGTDVITHTLSGTNHTGQLSDNQIPAFITRDSELLTTSGVLVRQIEGVGYGDIDGGFFV